jgi:hypothetical protein
MVQYAGSQDSSLVWNPKVHAYVDRNLYENAMSTQDPHLKSYTGVKPNFGGGLVKEGEGIGTTAKHMKKLTTVLSKNQKLHSMNAPSPQELTKKINL